MNPSPTSLARSLQTRVSGVAAELKDRADIRALTDRFGGAVAKLPRKEVLRLGVIAEVLDRTGAKFGAIYDIGAFDGMWSEAFAIYSGGQVFSFEPLSDMGAQVAERSRRSRGIHLQPVACGRHRQTMRMKRDSHKVAASSLLPMAESHKTEFPLTGTSAEVAVELVRLDDWRTERALPLPDLIKLDVQGFELEAIAGGEQTFQAASIVWIELNFVEFYQGGSTFDRSYGALRALGFELIDIVDPVRSRNGGSLLYVDGIFRNTRR